MVAPATLWLFLFLVVPLASIIIFSFWKSTGHGMAIDFTLEHYAAYFSNEGFFDTESSKFLTPTVFIRNLGSTLYFALVVMFFCLLLGYPIAYFLAMQVNSFKWQMALFLLAMVPFWTSYLIRAVAWLPMLGMKDSGEDKQHQGSLLYTSYGKGDFVYCSLSLYRQLRKGNPGAVRLLVNLLAR